jgi:hypothetical protein
VRSPAGEVTLEVSLEEFKETEALLGRSASDAFYTNPALDVEVQTNDEYDIELEDSILNSIVYRQCITLNSVLTVYTESNILGFQN